MFKFNKFRSGTRASGQSGTVDNERSSSWSPMLGSTRFNPAKIKSILKGEDLGTISGSELTFAETLFPAPKTTSAATTTPTVTKKLQRSKHTIDTTLVPAVVEKYNDMLQSPRGSVSVAGRNSVDVILEIPKVIARKSRIFEIENDSSDGRRKSCDPVMLTVFTRHARDNGDSRSTPEYNGTFSKRSDINSGRSWTWDNSSTSDEDLDRSMSSASYLSHDEEDEALEFFDAEERFLQSNTVYVETGTLDTIRRDQYPKLSLYRHVYMDHANLALSSRFQMEEHMKLVMAEGHMLGTKSNSFAEYATSAQSRLLEMFNTSRSEYSIVFTTGLRASYRLVANAYPFFKGSPLLLCQDNHDAVNQLIAAAVRAGGKPVLAPLEETDLSMTKANIRPLMKRRVFQPSGSLFVYPAQSSVTGIRHSMHWISKAHKSGWHVLLDASTLLPTGTVDLLVHRPDFVVGSFQSIVGYPSGMGFLLVRRSSFLVTRALGANAITLSSTARVSSTQGKDFHVVADDVGSLSKLSFAALDLGLQHLQCIGLDVINRRVRSLATWMVHKLKGLRQIDPEDWSLVNVYSPYMVENRGNIVSFNILDNAGEVVPPVLVERLAAKNQITLAVGSFSNPGVANLLAPGKSRSVKNTSVFERGSDFECLRVSLGPMSNFEDTYRVVQFITKFRDPGFLSSKTQLVLFIPGSESHQRQDHNLV